jgi:transposase InsO family protein
VQCTELFECPNGEGAVAWLEAEIARAGYAPLVLSTDNGSRYTSEVFRESLRQHCIVHLLNLPHKPQHNTHAERAVKEIKQVAGIPKGRLPAFREDIGARLRDAVRWLNGELRSGVLGGLTALEKARELEVAERVVDRGIFYREMCSAIEVAVQRC